LTTTLPTATNPASASGAKARAARLSRSLTLDQVATETGLSKGHLSRFERGEKTLSIAALVRLSRVLRVSVASLLGERARDGAFHLVRRSDRAVQEVAAEDGGEYRYAALGRPDQEGGLEAFVVELAPNASRSGEAQHGGDEAFLVLSGSVEVNLAAERLVLGTGDYLQFSGGIVHRIRALEEGSRVFVVVSGA
jgi:transcriptional regulator with XRE-family HTH domain